MKAIKYTPQRLLKAVMKERSQRVLERFGQVAISGVSNDILLSMFEEVKEYWIDQLRPTLISFCCEAVGAQSEVVIDAGVMVALADAGISIHDDIVDKTLKKRSRKTILGNYGSSNALLVGDLLIVKAWSLIHEMIRKTNKPMIIANFAEAYGNSCLDMCEGELDEISCRKNLETDLAFHEEVLWKINSGIKACGQLGAILGDGTKKEIIALSEVGKSLALILGIMDDIRDTKSVGDSTNTLSVEGYLLHRIENESVPLPLLYAAKSSKERYLRIKSVIEKTSLTRSDAKELFYLCKEAKAFTYVYEVANREADKAIIQLDSLKSSYAQKILKLIVVNSIINIKKMLPT